MAETYTQFLDRVMTLIELASNGVPGSTLEEMNRRFANWAATNRIKFETDESVFGRYVASCRAKMKGKGD